MKLITAVLGTLLLTVSATALAAKSCDELKSEIAAKLDAKGVKDYSLDVVATADVGEQKVVGSCGGGAQKIVYKRGT
jgi:hypothetical protein